MKFVCPFQPMEWAHKNISKYESTQNTFLVHVLSVGCVHGAQLSLKIHALQMY
jgi:hypothetical protein